MQNGETIVYLGVQPPCAPTFFISGTSQKISMKFGKRSQSNLIFGSYQSSINPTLQEALIKL